MRPLRLQIEGLTSFRERQEIDFAGFDLFVITGPTGAGKTTILDAVTLCPVRRDSSHRKEKRRRPNNA
jgi:DNA repair protein SbcC/Rad50